MKLADFILDLIFPKFCVGCEREGRFLCVTCRGKITPFPKEKITALQIEGIDELHIAFEYKKENPLSGFIHILKYAYAKSAADEFPELLKNFAPQVPPAPLIPVPLHRKRLLERGFNQAELIARALAGMSGAEVLPLLTRTRDTVPQATLTRAKRLSNLTGAFAYNNSNYNPPPPFLYMVDDVFTTGTTLRECAAILRTQGARKIGAIVLAHGY